MVPRSMQWAVPPSNGSAIMRVSWMRWRTAGWSALAVTVAAEAAARTPVTARAATFCGVFTVVLLVLGHQGGGRYLNARI